MEEIRCCQFAGFASAEGISTVKMRGRVPQFATLQTSCNPFFLKGKLVNVVFSKRWWYLFSVLGIFYENFKGCCWFCLLLKRKIRAGIWQHRHRDSRFSSFPVDIDDHGRRMRAVAATFPNLQFCFIFLTKSFKVTMN